MVTVNIGCRKVEVKDTAEAKKVIYEKIAQLRKILNEKKGK